MTSWSILQVMRREGAWRDIRALLFALCGRGVPAQRDLFAGCYGEPEHHNWVPEMRGTSDKPFPKRYEIRKEGEVLVMNEQCGIFSVSRQYMKVKYQLTNRFRV